MSRLGGTSALLQKVNSKLRGEKKEDQDDEGLGAYLSGLGKKSKLPSTKSKEIDWEHFDNVDDLSDENVPPKKKSPEAKFGAGGSKFLKKKIPENKETKLNNIVKKGTNGDKKQSTALSKAMGFSPTKYESKQDIFRGLSDSDMDMSFSMDGGHVLGDVESLTPAKVPRAKSPDKSASEDSMSIGRGGNKFLKKQYATEKAPSNDEHHSPIRKNTLPISKTTPSQQSPTKQTPFQIKRDSQEPPHKSSPPKAIQNQTGGGGFNAGAKFQQSKPMSSGGPSSVGFHSQHQMGAPLAVQQQQMGGFGNINEPDVDEDSSSMSMSIGKGGSRFMKKKTTTTKSEDFVEKHEKASKQKQEAPVKKAVISDSAQQGSNKKQDMFSLKSSDKYSTTVHLDSEDESLQGYIQTLANGSPSEVSLKSPPKSPKTPRGILKTPRTPRSLTPLEDIEEDEEHHSNDPHQQTISDDDEDSFKSDSLASTVIDTHYDSADSTMIGFNSVNVLDLDALDPPDFSPPEATNASTPKPGVKLQTKKSSSTHKKKHDDSSPAKRTNKKNGDRKPPPLPSPNKKDKHKKRKSSFNRYDADEEDDDGDDLFARLQTVDDLLGDNKLDLTDTDIGTDIEREDYAYEDDFDETRENNQRSPSPLRGILSPSPKPEKTPRSGRTPRVRYSLEEVTEVRSRSPSPEIVSSAPVSRVASMVYSEGFEEDSESIVQTEDPSETEGSVISERIGEISRNVSGGRRHFSTSRSRSDSEYYSDDFMSATESRWASKRKENALSSRSMESMDSEYSMYSDTFSEFSESRSEIRSKARKKQRKKQREAEIQTGASLTEMTYKWIPEYSGVAYVTPGYGLTNLDPKLVATHVVSADALEALTTYSPNVMALNEMMRQQLQLTENYINIQNHLHQSLINSTQPDFIYTTLEDTKRYIKKHKRPTLSFDEALRQVKQEMGMD